MKWLVIVAVLGLALLVVGVLRGSELLLAAGLYGFLSAGLVVGVMAVWSFRALAPEAVEALVEVVGGLSLARHRVAVRLAVLLYALACVLPCIDGGPGTQSGDPGFPDFETGCHWGLELLLLGHSGGNNGVPWSANVFLGAGLLCLRWKRVRTAFVLGLIATALGLTTWWARPSDRLLVGYYIWQASLVVLAVGAAWACLCPGEPATPEPNSARRHSP